MLNSNVSKVKTYVGSDGKLHFVNSVGADTALNFSKGVSLTKYEYTGCLSGFRGEDLSNFADAPEQPSVAGAGTQSCMVIYITNISGYANKKLDDFIIIAHPLHEGGGVYSYGYVYNSSKGRITIYPLSGGRFGRSTACTATVYLKS